MRASLRQSIENVFGINLPMSERMEDEILTWKAMYEDTPIWAQKGVEPVGIPSAVASEIARLTTMEMEVNVSGSAMGDYLNENLLDFLDNAREYTEYACATGGVMFKPSYNQNTGMIDVSVVYADEFFPTRIDSKKRIVGAVFPDQTIINDYKYTRLERHELLGNNLIIQNRVFCKKYSDMSSDIESVLGNECLLTDVPEWEYIEPLTIIRNVDKPLFAYFKMPMANHIEKRSPLGVSVYAKAKNRIKRADDQWAKIAWEYNATQAAVFADDDMFRHSPSGDLAMEENERRMYRTLDGFQKQFEIYSPTIRDTSLFNGLQNYFRSIEFQCNLAYGTLSDPNNVDKTAEEIRASKQRSFSMICDIQKAFEKAHRDLLEAMHSIAVLYGACQDGAYEASFEFDDSIAVNRNEMFAELMQLASAGMIRPEYVTSWYFNVSEEEALKMIAPAFDDTEDEKLPDEVQEE